MLDAKHGLYVLAGRDVFAMLQRTEYSHLYADASFYEIYQSQLYDLLNSRQVGWSWGPCSCSCSCVCTPPTQEI